MNLMTWDKVIICKVLCREIVEQVRARMQWDLPAECLLQLHEETWPHILISVEGIRKFLSGQSADHQVSCHCPDAGGFLSAEDIELIETIIINYYHYSPVVKDLSSGMGVSSDYYYYFQKIITKKFRRHLPQNLDLNDLVNEGWLKLLTNCHQYHYKSRFSVWSYSVFINAAREFLRKEKRHRFYMPHSLDEDPESLTNKFAVDCDIEKEIEEREKRLLLNKKVIEIAVQRTRDAVRNTKIMELYQENKKYREIAQELGLNIATVATIIHRIKKLIEGQSQAGGEEPSMGDEARGKVVSPEEIPQT